MQNKQNETPIHYEQPKEEDKSDYTTQRIYEPQSTGREQTSDRRGFLKRTGAAIVVGLGGILFGKKALADGIDVVVGEEEGLKKVTSGYDGDHGQEYDEKMMCEPICKPDYCEPRFPSSENNSDFKKVTENYDRKGKDNSGGVYNCKPACPPEYCNPCEPHCNPVCSPSDCHPECHPSCNPHTCNPN